MRAAAWFYGQPNDIDIDEIDETKEATMASKAAEQAIDRSILRDQIVDLDHTTEAAEYLASQASDWVANGPVTEYWGRDEDGEEWRVHLRHDTRAAEEAQMLAEDAEEDTRRSMPPPRDW